MTILATLCTILREDNLLLQRKSAGFFGEGKWNGVGGKLKPGESPNEGVKREVLEETGLLISQLKLHGVLKFYFGKIERPNWIVYVFSTRVFKGDLKSSEEGLLQWFSFDEIPYEQMWQDDKYWLPFLIKNRNFSGDFYFNERGTILNNHNLEFI
jgi:8-oxo-dGTP pyrophosphatase MutT (NUDIX family)